MPVILLATNNPGKLQEFAHLFAEVPGARIVSPNDAEIWRYAVQQQAAIITKDEDFAERCLYSRDQPVIVWLRIGNTSNQALLRWFVPLWPEIMRRIELGDRLIEVPESSTRR